MNSKVAYKMINIRVYFMVENENFKKVGQPPNIRFAENVKKEGIKCHLNLTA